MFFVRSFAAMYAYINEAVVTLTVYVDGAIVTLTTAIETAVTNLTTYVDGQVTTLTTAIATAITDLTTYIEGEITTLTTYVDEQIATCDRTVNRGNKTSPDYIKTQLIIDDDFHDLSFTGIVPEGTKFIQLQVEVQADLAGRGFRLKEKGYHNHFVCMKLYTQEPNIPIDYRFWIGINEDRVIEYSYGNIVWMTIDITVVAWKL